MPDTGKPVQSTTPVRVDDALRQLERDALADDGLMMVHADHVLSLLDERERLRVALADLHSWMRMWSELSRKVGREAEQAAGAIAAAGKVLAGLDPDKDDDDAE